MEFKKVYILVSDYETLSEYAKYAVQLCRQLQAKATLLAVEHVLFPAPDITLTGVCELYPVHKELDKWEARFAPHLDEACEKLSGIWNHVSWELATGFV